MTIDEPVPMIANGPAEAAPLPIGRVDNGRPSILRRILSFVALVFMAVFLGASLAGIVAGIGLLITLAAQHRLG
jgi:hypothetical protein